jgi:predicted HTH domain antitoxin
MKNINEVSTTNDSFSLKNNMSPVTVLIPDIILETHQQKLSSIREVLQVGMVTWEYLNGNLSLQECGDILNIGYRGFLELLWNKGIPIDGLNETELAQQISQLRTILND